jgi:predicted alpha/beta superfamily hydrolase
MQDGQNLSDPSTAFAGTWDLDATIERLAGRGLEAIVVGVHNTNERLSEYSPFPDRRHGGGDADAYLAFLADTLKPRIDRLFRTRQERDETMMLGSSMGGLVSLYAYFRLPSVFGRAGVMSPSIWYGQGAVLDFIEHTRTPRGRVYVDVGTQEGAGTLRDARRLGRLLVRQGFVRNRRRPPSRAASRLRYVEDPGGRHNEASWARRLEGALEFLLA